jgi:hypothetical protein
VLLSFDYDLSGSGKKTEALLEIYRRLLEIYSTIPKIQNNSSVDAQLAIVFEYLSTLPKDQRTAILGNKEIPIFIDNRLTQSTQSHEKISTELRELLSKVDGCSDLIVENEFHGLKSGVYPVDITIKDKKTGKILLFVELDGEKYHYIEGANGKQMLKRSGKLKEKLYEYHYPGVPFVRIHMTGKWRKTIAEEILEIIKGLVAKNVENKWSFLQRIINQFRDLFRVSFFSRRD